MALALSLSVLPAAALAQDANAPAAPTDAQRQAMHQTLDQFRQQADQLHQQMRSQILASMSSVHLREVGVAIGQLAISPNPDVQTAARQIDRILSPAERQRILALHTSFGSQMRQLHEQMRSQIQSEMPAGMNHPMMDRPKNGMMHGMMSDAGSVLLMALSPHSMMDMMMGGHGMMH
jgi:hypothetical protein